MFQFVVSRWYLVRKVALLLGLVWFVVGCGQNPVQPDPIPASVQGAYILAEGLWRQDNSTLARFDAASGMVTQDFFARVNPGLRIGDTANNMVLKGDTLYVVVSTSRSIEVIRASSGVSLGRIRMPQMGQEPRKMVIVNDTTAYVSNIDDSITEINPRTFTIRTPRIAVGPAPEGIAATSQYVVVANSGFGDFRANEPKAGTLSVVDLATRREIRTIAGLPNAGDVVTNRSKTRLYAAYRHLPMSRDSLGGIVEFDAANLQELRRWRMKSPSALNFSSTGDTLFYLGDSGVELLTLRQTDAKPTIAVRRTAMNEFWYGLGVHPRSSELWITNARDFSTNGEVIVRRIDGTIVRRFDVGINPNTVVFF
ncbi:MAG: hypothetical protein MUF71_08485 [Candidatus Kapabacteria bacterium]|jgi:hypothetical protein|nr:hypothetical protein [Candidatus Kapabacteria bacterium]